MPLTGGGGGGTATRDDNTSVSTLSHNVNGNTDAAIMTSRINAIYMEPEHLGQMNDSHLGDGFFQGQGSRKEYVIKIRRYCNTELSKDIKLWDDGPMWNVDPRKDNTILRDCMTYFNYLDKDVLFQARWWYTFRTFVKRCINSRRNNGIELIKKSVMTQCKFKSIA